METPLDTEDVQALVFSGHGRLVESRALGFAVVDPVAARAAARALQPEISFGLSRGQRTRAVQLLLSSAGLAALGGPAATAGLDAAFQEGIVTPQRSRALGDAGPSDPAAWLWQDRQVHLLLLVYGPDAATVESTSQILLGILAGGWRPVFARPMGSPSDRRESFGFRDGITSPRIDLGDRNLEEPGVDFLAPGEIVLGQRTAAGTILPPPTLGTNGTYVVVRQMEQDVQLFWNYWQRQGQNADEAVWLGAKAVGRWPNGMPVLPGPPGPEPAAREADILRPMTFAPDQKGLGCPYGAHIRRANPRDTLESDPQVSLAVVAQHRIIRRGRSYGARAPAAAYPAGFGVPELDDRDAPASAERGLLFMCLCSDLRRQFEFIQQTWLNNPQFADRRDEADPLTAGIDVPADSRRFSIPGQPLRRRLHDLPHWIHVRAGGYFLLPGKAALQGLLGV